MDRKQVFYCFNDICDWDKCGEDDLVVKPVIEYLSKLEDEEIFAFDDIMAELLYELDSRKLFDLARKYDKNVSDDSFLYSRCVGIMNGEEYFKAALQGKVADLWKMEFEAALYVPSQAWALKHGKDPSEYPHVTPQCIETGSNAEKWKA